MTDLKVSDDCVWIASIDPGKINFAFIIEEVNINQLQNIKNIPKNKRICKDSASEEYSNLLDNMFKSGKTILLENLNLSKGLNKEKYIDSKVFVNLTDELDKYIKYWDKCSYIIIEQQMSFGKKKNNTLCIKIAQHTFSYYTF